MKPKHDWTTIHALKLRGLSWAEIHASGAGSTFSGPQQLARMYSTWKRRVSPPESPETGDTVTDPGSTIVELHPDLPQIRTLEDLLRVLEVDTDRWTVRNFRGNSWQQHSVKRGLVTLLQVRADFERDMEREYEAARESIREMLEEVGAPPPAPWIVTEPARTREECLFTVAVTDPHIGMLSWAEETGQDYDSKIAVRDYGDAVRDLLGYTRFYQPERILYVVGNDLLHADTLGLGAKGAQTTRGTSQDVDSRLAKLFSMARQAVVGGINAAAACLPEGGQVDVAIVPGNHDRESVFKLGEVLTAWYRNDPRINVLYYRDGHAYPSVSPRKYYRYGRNLLGLTHGEEFKRKRDPLALIMATEAPPQDWAETVYREWLLGHLHAAQADQYAPVKVQEEFRTVRVTVLGGLTGTDGWHKDEGYQHVRTASAVAHLKSGGRAGFHEFSIL